MGSRLTMHPAMMWLTLDRSSPLTMNPLYWLFSLCCASLVEKRCCLHIFVSFIHPTFVHYTFHKVNPRTPSVAIGNTMSSYSHLEPDSKPCYLKRKAENLSTISKCPFTTYDMPLKMWCTSIPSSLSLVPCFQGASEEKLEKHCWESKWTGGH
jgi:hypothetical protein